MNLPDDLSKTLSIAGTAPAPTSIPVPPPVSFANGRYQTVRPLGEGGQKTAYLGRDPQDPWATPPPQDPYAQGYYSGQDPYAPGPGGWYPPPPPPGWLPPPTQQPPVPEKRGGSTGAIVVGGFLVLLGLWFLFRDQVGFDLGRVWPAIAVALGALMVLAAFLPRRSRLR